MSFRTDTARVNVARWPYLAHQLSAISFIDDIYMDITRLDPKRSIHSDGAHFPFLMVPRAIMQRALDRGETSRLQLEGDGLGWMDRQANYAAADTGPQGSKITQMEARFGVEPAGLHMNIRGVLDGVMDNWNAPPDAYPMTFEIDAVVPFRSIPELYNDWDNRTPQFRARVSEQVEYYEAKFGRS